MIDENITVIKPVSNYFDNFGAIPFKLSTLTTKKKVIFDLINVDYISSNVIDIIKKLHSELIKNKIKMEFLNCNVSVYNLLIKFGFRENEYLEINEKKI